MKALDTYNWNTLNPSFCHEIWIFGKKNETKVSYNMVQKCFINIRNEILIIIQEHRLT